MQTIALIECYLPSALADIVGGYLARAELDDERIAEAGHGELCLRIKNVNNGLMGACKGGHILIAKMMIDRGATCWDYGLHNACEGGHLQLVELIIAHGAICWDWGLWGACRGGHLHTAELMIARGATDWNFGLYNACRGGHPSLCRLMIAHGATYCECGRSMDGHLAA